MNCLGFCTGERETIDIFNLRLSSAISQDILTGENETFLGLSLVSKLDGDGIKELGRPPIDLIVALDVCLHLLFFPLSILSFKQLALFFFKKK